MKFKDFDPLLKFALIVFVVKAVERTTHHAINAYSDKHYYDDEANILAFEEDMMPRIQESVKKAREEMKNEQQKEKSSSDEDKGFTA